MCGHAEKKKIFNNVKFPLLSDVVVIHKEIL